MLPAGGATRDEIWFLKALRAAGERGRLVSALASRTGLTRLVEVQYVSKHPQSERKTLYIITDRGRRALADAPHKDECGSTADVRFGSKRDMNRSNRDVRFTPKSGPCQRFL